MPCRYAHEQRKAIALSSTRRSDHRTVVHPPSTPEARLKLRPTSPGLQDARSAAKHLSAAPLQLFVLRIVCLGYSVRKEQQDISRRHLHCSLFVLRERKHPDNQATRRQLLNRSALMIPQKKRRIMPTIHVPQRTRRFVEPAIKEGCIAVRPGRRAQQPVDLVRQL